MNRKKKSMRKRILAWALAAGMVVSGYSGNGFVMTSFAAESAAVETGKFGNKSEFTYTIEKNKLTIKGNGDMPNFDSWAAPWKSRLSSTGSDGIKVIEIDKGITSIGKNSFNVASGSSISEKNSVSEVILPPTLSEIKSKAFANLKKLDTIIIGTSGTIAVDAFEGSKSPAKWCYLGDGICPTDFGGISLQDESGTKDVTITMTKHYYDSEGKAESGSATTDKYIPKDIAEGTFYDGTSYNIKISRAEKIVNIHGILMKR